MTHVLGSCHYPTATGGLFSDCQLGRRTATTCGNGIESFKEGLYRIWPGVSTIGDSGVNTLGDTSAFVNPTVQLLHVNPAG